MALITREIVNKLRAGDLWLEKQVPVNDSQTSPICWGDHKSMLDTIDKLWRVAEAAKKYQKEEYALGLSADVTKQEKLKEALAALREE